VEQDGPEVGSVSRGQNVVYIMPHDWASIAQFLGPAIERIDAEARELQLLVITSDAEMAAVVAAAAVKLAEGRDLGIIAATSARRASTLLRARPAQIVSGTPETIVEMLTSAALKLDSVRAVCIAWADELVTRGAAAALETVMAELPKDGARVFVASELSPAFEELLARYARRARRVIMPMAESDQPVSLEYVTVSPHARLASLRRLIDDTAPASAVVFVRDDESIVDVRDLLRSLGYGDEGSVKIGLVASPGTELVVLFDLPASREELREAVAGARRTIGLIQPRQLSSLRTLAAGGSVKPYTLPDAGARARDRDEQLRADVRSVLVEEHFGRDLLALEPLLDEYDGIEIAAAVVQLLERERAARAAAVAAASAPRDRSSASMTRLFVTVGSRDNVRPGDLVGAIANQAGVSSSDIGKVDVRESHSLVEVSSDIVGAVIEKVTGTEIRGRRVVIRRDEERSARGERPGRDRAAGGRDRGDRPPRSADRKPRPDRGPRP
jgi:ATP-dependent RNA helicase DeaD